MTSDFVNDQASFRIGDNVYVLITLPERGLGGWTIGRVESEEIWKHTISSDGEPSPRRFYKVVYGRTSECHSSPSHGNILPYNERSRRIIVQAGGQWLNKEEL